MPIPFDDEKPTVCQRSLEFIAWATPLHEGLPRTLAAHTKLDRASTSIPLSIAKGNGKFGPAHRFRYSDIARGSAGECRECLDLLVKETKCSKERATDGKTTLRKKVSMFSGRPKHHRDGRLREDTVEYVINLNAEN